MFKKIIISTALVSLAGLVACGDDSSSNGGSSELPKSVKTFMDLGDIDCNAEHKCETILVEEYNDTYECDGSQWNMLFDGMPSKVCPAEEPQGGGIGGEEGGAEGGAEGSAEMVSCDLPHDVPEFGAEAGCIEFEKGDISASALSLRCADYDGVLGTGCSK